MLKQKSFSIKSLLPKRSKDSNKSDGGSVLVIAGGKKFRGAGLLSALAATRSGAGYTHLMTDLSGYSWPTFPDFIVHPMTLKELKIQLKKNPDNVVAMGPGVGTGVKEERLLRFLFQKEIAKVVLDADALTLLSRLKIKKLPASWILTPHEGELARLLHCTSKKVKSDRTACAHFAQKRYGCTILLKGAETLIVSTDLQSAVKKGTPALAKAGTGDVLLGMVAAFYAQGLSAHQAAFLGCAVHGEASRAWLKNGNDHLGLRPTDLIEELPKTIKRLRA